MDASTETPVGRPIATLRRAPAQLARQVRPAVSSLLVLTVLCGGLFPLAVFGLGRWLSPAQASGSLVRRGGLIVGSRLIGQGFKRSEYFQPRASAAGTGYDATQSGGTNLAPSNPKLVASVATSAADFRSRNGLGSTADLPIDAVTSSASGLDPDISPSNAALQVRRVAVARGWSEIFVQGLVAEHTRGRDLFFMGAPRVSVLELNLALDRAAALRSRR